MSYKCNIPWGWVIQPVKKFPTLMEPEDSLSYLQGPTTGPHPEPDASSPHLPILFP
jgi:hypothetical protein